ncbi:Scramblase [Dillenia turbinata]|uniref:Phospholipid scramblase n=1 Tax=Dillenia turbinata TaxID=194707 RepID=A0AAN8VEI9_9MAGN
MDWTKTLRFLKECNKFGDSLYRARNVKSLSSIWNRQRESVGYLLPRVLNDRFCNVRGFASESHGGFQLNRDYLVKLWDTDKKIESSRSKRRKVSRRRKEATADEQLSLQNAFGRWFSAAPQRIEKSEETVKPVLKQPPVSQSVEGSLKPKAPEEAQLAPLLARSNLLITRDIEWANLVFGFEQENRYAIVDVCYPQSPVGFIREQSNVLARQLLRTRRPFVATITDALGNELFQIRRPFWWITSSIYAEVNGKEIGVVHRQWHLWRRVYDLYLGNVQFALVENRGLWHWDFTLKDADGKVLAEINRDWRGFGFEVLFTDAGQYVIRFGAADPKSKMGAASSIEELDVSRPLTLSERAVVLALAVSLDNDYFSRHGGWYVNWMQVRWQLGRCAPLSADRIN